MSETRRRVLAISLPPSISEEIGFGSAGRMMEEVSDNAKGLALAVASSVFIGTSFILKKIGLLRAGKDGVRAGQNLLLWQFFFFFQGSVRSRARRESSGFSPDLIL